MSNTLSLSDLDIAFANMLMRVQPSHIDAWCLAALTSHAYQQGHACLVLDNQLTELVLINTDGFIKGQLSPQWRSQQEVCTWWQGETNTPLVWIANRLYLRRAWQDEVTIREQIQTRLADVDHHTPSIRPLLDALFPKSELSDQTDWQRVACALASRRQLSIITGGPGTGKTSTVVRLLALLQRIAHEHQQPSLTIGLAAPTGKAAARLANAMQQAIHQLPDGFQANLPTQAQTLHKWLLQESLTYLDCLIVDEASMIDLHMMAQLLQVLPLSTRLILLGDKDQLASVDAGAVLGQLCAHAEQGHYSAETVEWVWQHTGQQIAPSLRGEGSQLAQQIIMLRHSHRFDANSAIGIWANAVNQQQVTQVKHLWQTLTEWTPATKIETAVCAIDLTMHETQRLQQLIQQTWQPLQHHIHHIGNDTHADTWASACLEQLGQFQLLCTTRDGLWGLNAMNQRISRWLGIPLNEWSPGRVVMITRNDYTLNLMNGDMGICLHHPDKGLRVAFQTSSGIRWILPARLSHYEEAFAMTVHKSQGSEFNRVLLLLPEQDTAILTKELIYTAITRAKQQLILATSNSAVLFTGVSKAITRAGGLLID